MKYKIEIITDTDRHPIVNADDLIILFDSSEEAQAYCLTLDLGSDWVGVSAVGPRTCETCGGTMEEGYNWSDDTYYCSDACLEKDLDKEFGATGWYIKDANAGDYDEEDGQYYSFTDGALGIFWTDWLEDYDYDEDIYVRTTADIEPAKLADGAPVPHRSQADIEKSIKRVKDSIEYEEEHNDGSIEWVDNVQFLYQNLADLEYQICDLYPLRDLAPLELEVYILTETQEDEDALRQFNILLVTTDLAKAKDMLKAKYQEDRFGYFADVEKDPYSDGLESYMRVEDDYAHANYGDCFVTYVIEYHNLD